MVTDENSLKSPPQIDQTSDEIVIVPLFNKSGVKVGEAYFIQEPTELNFRSVHIYGEDVLEDLGLSLALTERRLQCNVTIFKQGDNWR